jgi:hypothetical protein
VETWHSGRHIVRCHQSNYGATEFNPGHGRGRFHPFQDIRGQGVPTLYGADSFDGSLSESVFHNVPTRGPEKVIRRTALKTMLVSTISARRDLMLVQLHGYGLLRLGLSRAELIEAEAQYYSETAAWAAALHARMAEADGLVWVSRKFDTSLALVLFGDRVARHDLEVIEPPLPLFLGPGFADVQRVAELAGIAILSE